VNKWLSNQETEGLILQIQKETISPKSGILRIKRVRAGGTFAHWKIALVYAEFLSAKIHSARTWLRLPQVQATWLILPSDDCCWFLVVFPVKSFKLNIGNRLLLAVDKQNEGDTELCESV
jgi:hypothetical protein